MSFSLFHLHNRSILFYILAMTYSSILMDQNEVFGIVDNTVLAKEMDNFMRIKLDKLTKDLYMNAEAALKGKGVTTSIDLADKENAQLAVKKGTTAFEITENKDMIIKKQRINQEK